MSEKQQYVEEAAKENQKNEKTERAGKLTPKHWAVIGIAAVLIALVGGI